MRFYISYLSNWKFLKKINFGGLKNIFFFSSVLYFCIYFFYNIDQISFDINFEKNIEVYFLEEIRKQIKFSNEDELIKQMNEDHKYAIINSKKYGI